MTRLARPRICIAHQTVTVGDAIGNDIVGAYRVLEKCGYKVSILCEFVHPDIEATHHVLAAHKPLELAAGFDLLLYHHSVHWPAGEELVERFAGSIVVKYHNITPPEYFAPYTEKYRDVCAVGRNQTAQMARMRSISRWQCDSAYNSAEIAELGIGEERRGVVPPFSRFDDAFRQRHAATYPREGPFVAMFLGRRAPNKGHAHILRTLAAWRDLYPETELRCRIVGATDPELDLYYRELQSLESALDLGGSVEWLDHLPGPAVAEMFTTSHLYLNLSEHEGFCVPVIEAQAIGMPTLSTGAAALPETVGSGQVVVPVPAEPADYDVIAGLIHEICVSRPLRHALSSAGSRNVFERFTTTVLESRFLGDLEPVLQGLEG